MAEASDLSETLEPQQIPPHIKETMHQFERAVGVFTDEFVDPKSTTKAAIIEGETQSGKTSFAAAVAFGLQQRLNAEKIPAQIFFTTAGLQETAGMPQELPTDRTGIRYEKLPAAPELAEFKGKTIIVLDEISQRSPNPYLWQKYTDLSGTVFLLISHPKSPYLGEWRKLFPEDTEVISMTKLKEFNETKTT